MWLNQYILKVSHLLKKWQNSIIFNFQTVIKNNRYTKEWEKIVGSYFSQWMIKSLSNKAICYIKKKNPEWAFFKISFRYIISCKGT